MIPYVEDGEEDEKSVDDEGHDVREGGEREGHDELWESSSSKQRKCRCVTVV